MKYQHFLLAGLAVSADALIINLPSVLSVGITLAGLTQTSASSSKLSSASSVTAVSSKVVSSIKSSSASGLPASVFPSKAASSGVSIKSSSTKSSSVSVSSSSKTSQSLASQSKTTLTSVRSSTSGTVKSTASSKPASSSTVPSSLASSPASSGRATSSSSSVTPTNSSKQSSSANLSQASSSKATSVSASQSSRTTGQSSSTKASSLPSQSSSRLTVSLSTLKTSSASTLASSSRLIASTSSKSAGSGTASTGGRSSGTISKSAIVSSGSVCVVTVFSTTTTTSVPFATITTYVNVVDEINGDDIEPRASAPPIVVITNDYTTSISTALTITTTSVPPNFVDYTTTITSYPPSGFIPVQDSLQGAGYDGLYSAVSARRKPKQRRAATCQTITSVITSVSIANTRVSFITDTSAATLELFPEESFSIYNPPRSTPFTLTEVSGTPTTIYAGTTTSTYTVTQPTATATEYAACTTNNFADYIQQANGTRNPINFVTVNGQTDFSFDIARDELNVQTAYQCCAYAIGATASVWIFLNPNFCVALYSANYPVGTCLGQNDPEEQFQAAYANITQHVIGNGYCGQVSSSYFSTDRGG